MKRIKNDMGLKYKIDVLEALKNAGYTTYSIRKNRFFGENAIQSLREHKPISWQVLGTVCKLLQCQPGDVVEYVEETEDAE